MKKMLLIAAVAAVSSAAQAATFNWGVSGELTDSVNGTDFGGTLYANPGATFYLFNLGYGASAANLDFGLDGTTLMMTLDGGSSWSAASSALWAGGVNTHEYTQSEFDNVGTWTSGALNVGAVAGGVFGAAADWSDVSNYTLAMLVVTDEGLYNFVAGNPTGFSNASGSGSTGSFMQGSFNAAGQGALQPIPEPTTGLLALAGVGMLLRRRRKA